MQICTTQCATFPWYFKQNQKKTHNTVYTQNMHSYAVVATKCIPDLSKDEWRTQLFKRVDVTVDAISFSVVHDSQSIACLTSIQQQCPSTCARCSSPCLRHPLAACANKANKGKGSRCVVAGMVFWLPGRVSRASTLTPLLSVTRGPAPPQGAQFSGRNQQVASKVKEGYLQVRLTVYSTLCQ